MPTTYPLSAMMAVASTVPMLSALDVNQALATVGIVIAICVALAAGYYTVKAKRAEVWRDTAEGYKAKAEVAEAALARVVELGHEKDIQIAKLEAKPNLDGVAAQLATAFRTNSDEHTRMLLVLEQIAATLTRPT